MAPPPSKFNRGYGEEMESPSNNLWVGNLTSDTTDADLMELFAKYGALDSVTTYSSRSFAFLYFKRVEDAKAAKDALQGTTVRGNPIKIEFARPVCSNFFDLILMICGFLYLYNNLLDIVLLCDYFFLHGEEKILFRKIDIYQLECRLIFILPAINPKMFVLIFKIHNIDKIQGQFWSNSIQIYKIIACELCIKR